MKVEIIDNFLPEHEFEILSNLIVKDPSGTFPFSILKSVAYHGEESPPWNWMAIHTFYRDMIPFCPIFEQMIRPMIIDRLNQDYGLRSLIRVKGNFYPWTETVKEHGFHTDYTFENRGAILCLNTCNGYTLFEDGTKVDSVANRLYLFDPQQKHCSSTTSNAMGRYNININFL